MRSLAALALIPVLLAGPALAQIPAQSSVDAHGEKPLDRGPNTPQANQAFMGGGVVLQGAPGAPAPAPQALPAPPTGVPSTRP